MAMPSMALLQACCQRCELLTAGGGCGAGEGVVELGEGYCAELGGYCTATGSQPQIALKNARPNNPNRCFIPHPMPRGKAYFIPDRTPTPKWPPLPAARRPSPRPP